MKMKMKMKNKNNQFFTSCKAIMGAVFLFIAILLFTLSTVFSVSHVYASWCTEYSGVFELQVRAVEEPEPEVTFGVDEADCWIEF